MDKKTTKVNPFNKLLFKIQSHLTENDLKGLKLMSMSTIPMAQCEEKSPIEYFAQLVEYGLLAPDNFDWLKDALDEMDKQSIIAIIEAYEKTVYPNSTTSASSDPVGAASNIHPGPRTHRPNISSEGRNLEGMRAITNRNVKRTDQPEAAIAQPSLGLRLTQTEPESAAHEADGGPVSASPLSGGDPFRMCSNTGRSTSPCSPAKDDQKANSIEILKIKRHHANVASAAEYEYSLPALTAEEMPLQPALPEHSPLSEEPVERSGPDSIDKLKAWNKAEQVTKYVGKIAENARSNQREIDKEYQLDADSLITRSEDRPPGLDGNKLQTDSTQDTETAGPQSSPAAQQSDIILAGKEPVREDKLNEQKPQPEDWTEQKTPLTGIPDYDYAFGEDVEMQRALLEQFAQLKMSERPPSPVQLSDRPPSPVQLSERPLSVELSMRHPSPVELYNYQRELADAALQGHNCIICAPTGSGKTLTAGYVCFNMWQKAKQESRPFKALFIVCIRNLINQQKDALRQLFAPTYSENIVDGISEFVNLAMWLEAKDVVVLTAQILVNALKSKELTLRDVDLLIMDECHHTNLQHPYNIIMQNYHEDKRTVRSDRPLPQILGLTASLGVGANKDNASSHYILMCANLDCTKITHVRKPENVNQLLKQNPKPKKDQIIGVRPRDPNDLFVLILTYLMKEIEMFSLLPEEKPPQGTQRYENWVVMHRQEAEEKDHQDTIYGCQTLNKLNSTLMFYDDLQAREVLPILEDHFSVRSEEPRDVEKFIYELYDQQIDELKTIAIAEKIDENAKLECLCQLLCNLYTDKPQSKGILLTRTRIGVEGLVSFVERQEALKDVVKPAKFVGQGRCEGTMTDTEQEKTLSLFKQDSSFASSVNLLVATDIAQEGLDMPQCNFVIRYNFVSNEIGSVQSKGRARAKNSQCYLIVNKNSTNESREYENLEKEHAMLEALKEIDKKDPRKLREEIFEKQKRILEELQTRRQNKAARTSQIDSAQVTIHCKNCKLMLCRGSDMRKRSSNFIVIDPEFVNKIDIKNTARKEFREDTHIGRLFCSDKECQRVLGLKLVYHQGFRLHGYVLSKDGVMWKLDHEQEYKQIKQWSKVPFPVEEENMTFRD